MKSLRFVILFSLLFVVGCTKTIVEPAPEPNYKEYVAFVSQSDTLDPVAVVISNTFSATPKWKRVVSNFFTCSLDSAFTPHKTVVDITPYGSFNHGSFTYQDAPNYIGFYVADNMFWASITIKVYN